MLFSLPVISFVSLVIFVVDVALYNIIIMIQEMNVYGTSTGVVLIMCMNRGQDLDTICLLYFDYDFFTSLIA